VVLLMYFVANIFLWLQGYVLNRIVMKVIRQLRDDTEKKLNRLPLNYFDTRQRGDVLSRVTNDVDNIQQALQQAFAQLISSVLTVIGIVIMMFIVSWQLALIALVALPLSGVSSRHDRRAQPEAFRSAVEEHRFPERADRGILLRARPRAGLRPRRPTCWKRFEERNEALYKASFGAQFVSGIIFPVMQFVSYLSYVGIAVVGGLRVASGSMSLGDATAFIQYSREFTQPLGQMAGMANMLQSGVASSERVFEFLDADEQDVETATEHLPAKTDGHVDFKDVTFSYTEDKKLIENLSFTAEPGNTVAIVGPHRRGQDHPGEPGDAVLRAQLRVHHPGRGGRHPPEPVRTPLQGGHGAAGRLAVRRVDLRQHPVRQPGRHRGPGDGRAKATFVDRFVRALPDGYDTVIDEEGNNVSAGEKQLITIARAFVANPSLLILDEATSSVDTRTELLVQKAMAALRTDRTSFVIAHRLSTIRDADTILVMENGKDRGAGQPQGPPGCRGRLLPAVHVPVRRRGRRGRRPWTIRRRCTAERAEPRRCTPQLGIPRRIEVLVPMRWGTWTPTGTSTTCRSSGCWRKPGSPPSGRPPVQGCPG
jgi:ATP-binding cassette subfamily B multidrug efflux pump